MLTLHQRILLSTLCGLVIPFNGAGASWFSSVEGTLLHDDNLSRAQLAPDIESDNVVTAALNGGYAWELENGKRLTLLGALQADGYDKFDGLNRIGVALEGAFRKRLGLGADAPALRLAAKVKRDDFDVDVRDAWSFDGSASLERRFGERWSVTFEIGHESRRADDSRIASSGPGPGPSPGPGPGPGAKKPGDAFDTDLARLGVAAELTLSGGWWVDLGYTYFDGDVVSSSTSNTAIVAAADAITDDPVFGVNRLAYRLDANSHLAALSLGHSLGESGSLSFGYSREETHGRGGIDYDKSIVSLTAAFSF